MENTIMHIQSTILRAALVTLSLLALHATAAAQEATRMRSDHAIGVDAGLESAFITRVGYSYQSDVLGDDGRFYARFTLPFVAPDLGDFALDGGVRVHLIGDEGWGVQAAGGPVLRHAENALFASTALGLGARLLPGYQTERWGVLLDLGIEHMLTTQIEHSEVYERRVYADAKSGWYALSAGTLHAGLRSGLRVAELELSLSAGMLADTTLQPKLIPYYLTLGAAYSL
jgi:hypothetical protein